MRRAMAAFGLAVLIGGPALGAEPGFTVRNAGDLAQLCQGGPGGAERTAALNFCYGFAQGALSVDAKLEKGAFCIPSPSPSKAQTMNEFAGWVRADPQRGGFSAAEQFIDFIKQRYPCKA